MITLSYKNKIYNFFNYIRQVYKTKTTKTFKILYCILENFQAIDS